MRTNLYLSKRLNSIWENHFSDVPRKNEINIRFGREANYRFGSIRYCYVDRSVHITINGRFQDEKYPAEIIDHTISHELCHYTHGFPTPGPRLSRYPHRGGIIDKEMAKRGLGYLITFYKSWVKAYIASL
jgi:hypothetical protein